MIRDKGRKEKIRTLIYEYEWLRQQAKVLDWQINQLDARLIEIERQLPDSYKFPDDPPLTFDSKSP
jgi:hypothetical protein